MRRAIMTKYVIDILLTADLVGENHQGGGPEQSTDVIVQLSEGMTTHQNRQKYVATFFTYESLLSMKDHHFKTGEYLNGKYFFFKNMVIIDNCSKESITEVVNDLINEGEFEQVFEKL